MCILFDQGTPVPLARHLREHTIRTALQEGWDRLRNGDLLRACEDAGFDVLVTTDNSIAYRQNLRNRRIAIIVLSRNQVATGSANDSEDRRGSQRRGTRKLPA